MKGGNVVSTKGFFKNDKAVSPMIATIMLIVIVASLGPVIPTSSMKSANNIGGRGVTSTLSAQQQLPGSGVFNLTVAHEGGDQIEVNQPMFPVMTGANSPTNFVNFTTGVSGGSICLFNQSPGWLLQC